VLGEGVSLIEWPERCGNRLPENTLYLNFAMDGGNNRICTFDPRGNWVERLKGAP